MSSRISNSEDTDFEWEGPPDRCDYCDCCDCDSSRLFFLRTEDGGEWLCRDHFEMMSPESECLLDESEEEK